MPRPVSKGVEITIEGFSGPLDMLCHLVESRQMQASKIKVAQLVRIYGAYLLKTQKASVDALADFFFMAAELLLQKTLSLLPSAPLENEDEDFQATDEDAALMEKLARYRPYRAATAWLLERKARQDKCYRRLSETENTGEPIYEIGDIYFLSRVWWGLIERALPKKHDAQDINGLDLDLDIDSEEAWDGVPEILPEESQIESRIAELEEKLRVLPFLSLISLWRVAPTIKTLVMTLLAVLEMCRMGKVTIEQETLFSDVTIRAK